VNSAGKPYVKAKAAEALEIWLTGDTAKALIEGYRLEGQQLFRFNARPM
jgi:tungstate transport system substrate-binding protein